MKLIDEYNIRVDDIDSFYEILTFIDRVETHKNKPIKDTNDDRNSLMLSRNAQKSMRAEAFLLLYNIIESTINNCFRLIFETIQDAKLTYHELELNIRKYWISTQYNTGLEKADKICKVSFEIAEKIRTSQIIISRLPNTSGNLDMRTIIELCKKVGVELGHIPNYRRTADILLSIKNKRNDLAHGNKSFSDVGKLVTLSELIEAKDAVLIFLEHVIKTFQDYIDAKKFQNKDGDVSCQ